jgi:hypothetical protein
MTFLHPLLLAGAAMVAVPIVLHLLMRRKPRRLEFPALQLVRQRHDTNRRRLRLRHLILLALRMAAIGLLALALARPSIHLAGSLGSQEEPVAAALAFDTSMRMEYRHQNRTRLEAAQEFGLWLLAQLPAESQVAVLDSRAGPGAFQVDRGAAQQRIERLQTVAAAQPLVAVAEEGIRLLGENSLARKELYIFTDMTRAGWSGDAGRLRQRAAELGHLGVYLIDVGVADPVDFALGDLRLSSQVVSQRSTLRIATEISHCGKGGQRTVELYLLDKDRRGQKRDERTVKLQPDQSQTLDFHVGDLPMGTHQGYLQILGEDGLAADDRRYFTVEVKPAWRVLIVAPPRPERRALFLTQALAPTDYVRQKRARFDCQVISYNQLPSQKLEDYSAVYLLDPGAQPPAVWQNLANFAADGHGVAIFLGRHAEPVAAFNGPGAQDVLAGKLVVQARRPDGDLALAPADLEHPLLAPLRVRAGAIPWSETPVTRYWQLDELAAGTHTIIPYSDGRPAVVERPVGKGRVLTVTTPISDPLSGDPWNLLPLGWPFWTVMQQMGDYLAGSSGQQWNYFAGQTAVVKLDPQRQFHSYLLTGPDQVEMRISPELKQNVLVVGATDRMGNYRLRAGGSDGADLGFSVNLPADQTELERFTDAQLVALFGQTPVRLARSQHEIDRQVSAGRVGRELFPLLIALTAVVLALEHLAANRFYRE